MSAASTRSKRSSSSSRAPAALGAAEVVQVGHQDQVLAAGQQVVDGRELAGDADRGAHRVGLARRVVAGDAQLAAVGGEQRREDLRRSWSCRRRWARAARRWCPRRRRGRRRRARRGRRRTCAGRRRDRGAHVIAPLSGRRIDDVAERGAGAHLDRLGRLSGRLGGLEQVSTRPAVALTSSHAAVPSRDADLDVADRGLEHDRAAHDLPQPDVAVGGLGHDVALGAVDRDGCRWRR